MAMPGWQVRLAALAACTLPGILLRIGAAHAPPALGCVALCGGGVGGGLIPAAAPRPALGCVGFGGAVMAAGFIPAAAAETAEVDLPHGIATAAVAFVAVLPEYAIEVYFAFTGQVELTTASLTGATRLLLSFAVGMPALALLVGRLQGRRLRPRRVELEPGRRVDLGIIAAASLYAPLIVLRGQIGAQDAIVLLGLYGLYLRRLSTGKPEPPQLMGVAAELAKLPDAARKRWVAGLMGFAAFAILVTAEPFAQSVI